jgi:hypothetical protein
MSVYQVASGRWVARVSVHRKIRHIGTFDTRAEAEAAVSVALPPKPDRPLYLVVHCGHETPCWVWQRATSSNGYGRLARRECGERWWEQAHRYFYEQHVGPIPDGLQLDHLCRNRRCVNPGHLEAVTQAENCRRGANAKLTADHVAEIRSSDEPAPVLAARYGVHASAIQSVRSGWTWAPDTNELTPRRQRELARAA